MKKVLLILLVVGVVFAAVVTTIVVGVFSLTSGLGETVDGFFAEVKRGDMAKARDYLAEDFKKSTTDAQLQAFLADSGLLKYKEASWSSRSIKNGRGRLEGEATTEDGATVPLEVDLVEEQERWKIYAMRKAGSGVADTRETVAGDPAGTDGDLPGQAEARTMTKQALRDFAVSADAKSMQHFFGTTSKMWQEQMTVAELDAGFKAVMDYGFDLQSLESLDPIIEKIERDAEGALVVQSRYDSSPEKVFLKLRYVQEDDWKLLGFDINIRP